MVIAIYLIIKLVIFCLYVQESFLEDICLLKMNGGTKFYG